MSKKHPHRKQTFTFDAPAAKKVQLAGDFTHWEQSPIPLEKDSNGTWQTSVELRPGQHHYRFLVDDQWCDDPGCGLHLPNPFGTRNSVREVM